MSIFDALGLLDILQAAVLWRFFVALAIGIGAGLGIYYATGQTPASAGAAFGVGLAGLCVGLVWQLSSRRRQ